MTRTRMEEMVSEKRLLVSLKDITHVEFKCSGCDSALTLSVAKAFPSGLQCPQCNAVIAHEQADYKIVDAFFKAMDAARRYSNEKLKMSLVLPIE